MRPVGFLIRLAIPELAREFGVTFNYAPMPRDPYKEYLDEIIDSLELWCKAMSFRTFSATANQIGIAVSIADRGEAAMFKLRWHHVLDSCEF